MKKLFLTILVASFALASVNAGTFPTPAQPVPWGWSCSEFRATPVNGGTVVQFILSGIGKWTLVGDNSDFSQVLIARGPITPAGQECVFFIPTGTCQGCHLLVQAPDGGWRIIYPWLH